QVAGVGKGLLIAGEIGGEDNFTERWIDRAHGGPGEPGAVLQQNESGAIGHPVTPPSRLGLTSPSWGQAPRVRAREMACSAPRPMVLRSVVSRSGRSPAPTSEALATRAEVARWAQARLAWPRGAAAAGRQRSSH